MATVNESIIKATQALKDYVDTNYQLKQDDNLNSENKTVIGAINEILSKSTQQVFNAETHYDFPSIGSINVIYKAYKERKTYQWNSELLTYETLDEDDIGKINLIDGGNADGN